MTDRFPFYIANFLIYFSIFAASVITLWRVFIKHRETNGIEEKLVWVLTPTGVLAGLYAYCLYQVIINGWTDLALSHLLAWLFHAAFSWLGACLLLCILLHKRGHHGCY